MTREQLMAECEALEPPKGYRLAIAMAVRSMELGDTAFSTVAGGVAVDLMQRNLHKPKRHPADTEVPRE